MNRYNPSIEEGLNDDQIEERKKENLVNYDTTLPTKSIKQILKDNFLTLFNILNLALAIIIFSVGSYKNATFLIIVILNTAISTFQEIHSKKVIDKLSIIASSKVTAIRNSKKVQISLDDIVLDDILVYSTGSQISVDSIIKDGEVEVNESFITGEPDSTTKKVGDVILSGSYIVSGKCYARVEHIGEDNYTAKISSGAKYVKKVNSEIMNSLKKIIKILTYAIIPIGIILFLNQLYILNASYQTAVVSTVAAIIGMIPEGLVLLTSTVLAVSVIRLSKSKVLVQQLYCIETLARVDTLCLDKTGTLTEGKMEVIDTVPIKIDLADRKGSLSRAPTNNSLQEINNILANLAQALVDENSTINAIREKYNKIESQFIVKEIIPFSSKTKWSGAYFEKEGSYIIGAPEFVLKDKIEIYRKQIDEYAKDYRVVVLAHSKEQFREKNLPNNIELIGLILLTDKIRKEANNTLKYFKEQGVDIKIISGDNPVTVSKVAKFTGMEDYENYIDMSTIKTEEQIKDIADKYTIFGRVTPMQKKLLILTLKEKGKTVAMTGDGVNDVLALKEADCSIAMANGSDATKSVSELVLLDSNFSSMPKVVAEGRRTINNIERSASLFLVKTIYSTILAIMFIFLGELYPFEPVQLSLISVVTIGIPSFLLALEPNWEKITGSFLKNVISKAMPTALTAIFGIVAIVIANKYNIIPEEIYSSICVISTGFVGILLLFTLARRRKSEHKKLPVSKFRLSLAITLVFIFILGLTVLNWWFNIAPLNIMYKHILNICIIDFIIFLVLNIIIKKILKIT